MYLSPRLSQEGYFLAKRLSSHFCPRFQKLLGNNFEVPLKVTLKGAQPKERKQLGSTPLFSSNALARITPGEAVFLIVVDEWVWNFLCGPNRGKYLRGEPSRMQTDYPAYFFVPELTSIGSSGPLSVESTVIRSDILIRPIRAYPSDVLITPIRAYPCSDARGGTSTNVQIREVDLEAYSPRWFYKALIKSLTYALSDLPVHFTILGYELDDQILRRVSFGDCAMTEFLFRVRAKRNIGTFAVRLPNTICVTE